ncbi:MAG TPA: hypothetical protein VFH66_03135 [Mycobacteriales bacterium]|nr:hypothetical protein [Mycobacteriales bacterium]
MSESASIKITRDPAVWRDRGRAYKVLIDGRQAGTVRHGETFVTSVSPGTHSVRLRIDWTGSQEVQVAVAPGATTSLVCAAGGSSWTALFDALGRRPYISLRPE